jgi:hypothetical protein
MALSKGTNSYVTATEADGYFENRLDVAAWNDATDDQKEQALVTATMLLDEMNWTGVAVDESQSLAFPRVGIYFDPKTGSNVEFDDTDTPTRVVNATYELAYHLLNNDGLLDESGSATNIKVGRVLLEKVKTPSKFPSHVKRSLRPLLVNAGANLWWRAW